jgi:hypothetical protein
VASFSLVLAGLRSASCCSRRGALGVGRGDKEGGWGERGLLLLLLASSFSLLLLLVIAFAAENKAQHMHVCARCVGQAKMPPLLAGAWLLLAASGVKRGRGRGGPLSPPILFLARALFASMLLLLALLFLLFIDRRVCLMLELPLAFSFRSPGCRCFWCWVCLWRDSALVFCRAAAGFGA